jgi:transglutaminase-like putative cysteine protease
MGSGQYKISILENIEGTSYRAVMTQTVDVSLSDPLKVYLNSIQNVDWNNSMKAIIKAGELTRGLNSDSEKIKAIYDYITENISYDETKLGKVGSNYIPSIDDTIAKKSGICYDYASLFAAMLRSAGIPAKLVKGYTPNVDGYHAWNEVYMKDSGEWVVIDTTYDSQLKAADYEVDMIKDSKSYNKSKEY